MKQRSTDRRTKTSSNTTAKLRLIRVQFLDLGCRTGEHYLGLTRPRPSARQPSSPPARGNRFPEEGRRLREERHLLLSLVLPKEKVSLAVQSGRIILTQNDLSLPSSLKWTMQPTFCSSDERPKEFVAGSGERSLTRGSRVRRRRRATSLAAGKFCWKLRRLRRQSFFAQGNKFHGTFT